MKTIRVAAGQIRAFPLDQADESLKAVQRMIEQAAQRGADLLVLPECAYPAYLLGSVERYRAAPILSPDEYLIVLARLARKKKMHIVSGFVEDVGTHLHNSAVLIDDNGQQVGMYRKSFLWANDNEWFKPGDRVPVFDTSIGRIGMVICADTRAPEILAKLACEGAEVIAMPTCWINVAAKEGGFENPQPEFLIPARAAEFKLPFVCANKFGMENEKVGYCGRSIIAAKTGELLQEAAGDEEVVLDGEIELRDSSSEAYPTDHWHELLQRKEEIRPEASSPAPVLVELSRDGTQGAAGWCLSLTPLVKGPRGLSHGEGPTTLLTSKHAGSLQETPFAKIACLGGEDFKLFARSRLMALDGAEIVCVFDAADDVKLLRTRAIENCTFVLALGGKACTVVAPSGKVLMRETDLSKGQITVEINVAEAANKLVAPRTDIWQQRRVGAYRK